MKNNRECPECKIKYEPSRSDQKYCSDTCRWNAWRERENNKKGAKQDQNLSGTNVPENTKEPEKKDLFASLRSVPENKATQTKVEKTEMTVQPKIEQEKVAAIKEIQQVSHLETKEYKEVIDEKHQSLVVEPSFGLQNQ